MNINSISLNNLRAFEASARHLNLTRAADELCVTQAAVSHQVKALEEHIGKKLFRRTSRGLVLSDEGALLAPIVSKAISQMGRGLEVVSGERTSEILTVGVVGTFAVGFLLDRLPDFNALYPEVDVRVQTNNNVIDLWTEDIDCAIRFGDGSWHGVVAKKLMPAPMSPLCSVALAKQIQHPDDLARHSLLRSYRRQDWPAWFEAAGRPEMVAKGPIFDSSHHMALTAMKGDGIALLPTPMFQREKKAGQLVQPFPITVDSGSYWLTRLASRPEGKAMAAFEDWLLRISADNDLQ